MLAEFVHREKYVQNSYKYLKCTTLTFSHLIPLFYLFTLPYSPKFSLPITFICMYPAMVITSSSMLASDFCLLASYVLLLKRKHLD